MSILRVSGAPFAVASTGSVTANIQAVKANDIIVLLVESAAQNVAGVDLTASGWTSLSFGEVGTAGATDATRMTAYWKRASADAAATTVNVGDYGDHTIAMTFLLRGCLATSNPIQWIQFVPTTKGSSTSSYSFNISNSTTATTTYLVVGTCLPIYAASSYDMNTPTGLTQVMAGSLIDVLSTDGTGNGVGNSGGFALEFFTKSAPGAVGTFTGTYGNSFTKYVGFAIAVTPAPRRYPRTVSITY